MISSSKRKTRSGVFACTIAVMLLSSGAALGGEITGNGKDLKDADGNLKGKSQCAFSGREDTPGDPFFKGLIAQSWGQLTKEAKAFFAGLGLHPGNACNPTKGAPEE